MGSNDLCDSNCPPEVVLQNVDTFLDHLKSHGVTPQKFVFLSVIRRTVISRSGQVSCSTFTHRAKKLNRLLTSKLKERPAQARLPNVKPREDRTALDNPFFFEKPAPAPSPAP